LNDFFIRVWFGGRKDEEGRRVMVMEQEGGEREVLNLKGANVTVKEGKKRKREVLKVNREVGKVMRKRGVEGGKRGKGGTEGRGGAKKKSN
jgi:hypothetical protein